MMLKQGKIPSPLRLSNAPLGVCVPFGALEEEMATHFRILAWEIPWTEEAGGLQSMGLQRIRHN